MCRCYPAEGHPRAVCNFLQPFLGVLEGDWRCEAVMQLRFHSVPGRPTQFSLYEHAVPDFKVFGAAIGVGTEIPGLPFRADPRIGSFPVLGFGKLFDPIQHQGVAVAKRAILRRAEQLP